ncbi:MAG: hypothetical protein JXR91_08745 [Deltaproteobacteria bacterium]|nr:hypothetical protein [Deltaproteobacteria bacterium]
MKNDNTLHTFQIPVMGTGYTAESPLKVAKYGISSVISLVDDILLEQLHKFHSEQNGIPFTPADKTDPLARAYRITAYLNFIDKIVKKEIEEIKKSQFTEDSDITKYFEMIPNCPVKEKYNSMLSCEDSQTREKLQNELREYVVPGSIDVNIMTKIDRPTDKNGDMRPKEQSDAMLALKGFADSTVEGSLVLSAGFNPRLYGYLSEFNDFFPDKNGKLKKKIVLKVSDYRSAFIQSKFLGRNGLWVSEFRIESSLNCGGHAFPTEGFLLGPILDEFKKNREKIIEIVALPFLKSLKTKGFTVPENIPTQSITVQGGIGTSGEDSFLMSHYNLEGTGWATPFLLVPEATSVDEKHLAKLENAGDELVYLSDSSPLQVPFWMLKNSDSEEKRLKKIKENNPGASCPKGYLVSSTDFTKQQLCLASAQYQQKRLKQIEESKMTEALKAKSIEITLARACICHDLGGGATIKNNIVKNATPTVCTGPNIVNFSKRETLKSMVDHIYGRKAIELPADRPHVFILEISLYFDALIKQYKEFEIGYGNLKPEYFGKFTQNLQNGLDYYADLIKDLPREIQSKFTKELKEKQEEFILLKKDLFKDSAIKVA